MNPFRYELDLRFDHPFPAVAAGMNIFLNKSSLDMISTDKLMSEKKSQNCNPNIIKEVHRPSSTTLNPGSFGNFRLLKWKDGSCMDQFQGDPHLVWEGRMKRKLLISQSQLRRAK